jgi:hypothetical protein
MEINQALQKLEECGCKTDAAAVTAYLQKAGIQLEALTDRDIAGLSEALSKVALTKPNPPKKTGKSAALATANSEAPIAPTNPEGPIAPTRQQNLQARQAAGEFTPQAPIGAFAEMDALEQGFVTAIDGQVDVSRKRIGAHFSGAAPRLLAGVLEDLQGAETDPAFFRKLAEQIGAAVQAA